MLSEIAKYISIFSIALLISSSTSFAEEDGAYFQKWDEGAQRGFVSTTISGALTIASQTDKALTQCIFEWYGKGDDEVEAQREDEVIEAIGKYIAHQPYAVVLAVIQKQCGKFPAL